MNEILSRALDDMIQAAEVAFVAQSVCDARTAPEIRETSVEIVRELLERGLIEIGQYVGARFEVWTGSIESIIKRIVLEWDAFPSGPNLGDIFWLQLTEKGREAGEALSGSDRG